VLTFVDGLWLMDGPQPWVVSYQWLLGFPPGAFRVVPAPTGMKFCGEQLQMFPFVSTRPLSLLGIFKIGSCEMGCRQTLFEQGERNDPNADCLGSILFCHWGSLAEG
jgi:hypothetical protein